VSQGRPYEQSHHHEISGISIYSPIAIAIDTKTIVYRRDCNVVKIKIVGQK
jgi:hypothetical protein